MYFKFQKEIWGFQVSYPEKFMKNQVDFNNYKPSIETNLLPIEVLI